MAVKRAGRAKVKAKGGATAKGVAGKRAKRQAASPASEPQAVGRPRGECPGEGWVRVEELAGELEMSASGLRKSLMAGKVEVREGWVQRIDGLRWRKEQIQSEARAFDDLNALDQMRHRKLEREVEKLDLVIAELAGAVIRIQDHQRVVEGHAAIVRQHLEALPKAVGARTRNRKAQESAQEAVDHALAQLAEAMRNAGRRRVGDLG